MGESKEPRQKLRVFTRRSHHHREAILASTQCGCYYCCEMFKPEEIKRWIEPVAGEPGSPGQTAICPHCGVDMVVGDGLGKPFSLATLEKIHLQLFGPDE